MWIIRNSEMNFLISHNKSVLIFSNSVNGAMSFATERLANQFLRQWKKNKAKNYSVEFYAKNKRCAILLKGDE